MAMRKTRSPNVAPLGRVAGALQARRAGLALSSSSGFPAAPPLARADSSRIGMLLRALQQ